MKSYVRYNSNDTIISGVLVKANKKPTGVGWVEIPTKRCCGTFPVVAQSKHKAFVKYASGSVVLGSTIIRKRKPQVGTWVEVPYKKCCGYIPPVVDPEEEDVEEGED